MSQRKSQQFKIKMLGGEFATNMTCEDAGCQANREGWLSVLDVNDPKHAGAANWIKEKSGRRFFEFRSEVALEELLRLEGDAILAVTDELRGILQRTPPGMVVFVFPPGQQCFRMHEDREVVFQHQRGVLVGPQGKASLQPTSEPYIHVHPRDFNEHMNEEGYKVNRALQRG